MCSMIWEGSLINYKLMSGPLSYGTAESVVQHVDNGL